MLNNPIDSQQVRQAFSLAAKNYDNYALLQKTVADRLLESFEQIKINPTTILDLGSGTGYALTQLRQRFSKAHIYQLDVALEMLKRASNPRRRFFTRDYFLCADSNKIPLAENSIDVVFSSLMLQWLNQPDTSLAEIQRVLKPGGVFVFTTLGPDTLKELRASWTQADDHVHINTFIDMHDIGDGLIRAGLEAPVLSVENIVVTYSECLSLMRDLKNIGAHNVNHGRRKTLTGKQRLQTVLQHYESYRHNDTLPATYEVIYGHAWQSTATKKTTENKQSITLASLKQALRKRK